MRKLILAPALCSVIMLASCGHNANGNSANKTKTDSAANALKGDTEKHDKLVVALVKDTNTNNYKDEKGRKQGHWVITNETEHLPGFAEKAKVAEGDYQDGMKEGEWTEYNADGSVKSRTTFKNDKPVN